MQRYVAMFLVALLIYIFRNSVILPTTIDLKVNVQMRLSRFQRAKTWLCIKYSFEHMCESCEHELTIAKLIFNKG